MIITLLEYFVNVKYIYAATTIRENYLKKFTIEIK